MVMFYQIPATFWEARNEIMRGRFSQPSTGRLAKTTIFHCFDSRHIKQNNEGLNTMPWFMKTHQSKDLYRLSTPSISENTTTPHQTRAIEFAHVHFQSPFPFLINAWKCTKWKWQKPPGIFMSRPLGGDTIMTRIWGSSLNSLRASYRVCWGCP